MTEKEGFGLVFAGGGGKGAYEIGVWKALLKMKQIKIGAASGTSVGALNAAMYAAGNYEKAENIWNNIEPDKILTPDPLRVMASLQLLISGLAGINKKILIPASINLLANRYSKNSGGIFSREGLKKIIEESGMLHLLQNSKIPCYATCYNINECRTQYFQLNHLSRERIVSVLLASSAIPGVFPTEWIGGEEFCDGGIPFLGDNVPVKPLYDAGWRKFLVVHLDREGIEEFSQKFKGCQFVHIFPQSHQGGLFTGTLDFTPQSAKKRIEQGYKDLMRQVRVLNDVNRFMQAREEKAEEIHFYSGRYYSSINKVLESCKRENEAWNGKQLETEEDLDFTDLEDELDKICDELARNKTAMNEFVLKGITAISAANGQLDERHRKGFFKNLLGGITGKNRKLQQGIDKELINSQQAVIKMISRLVESDKVTIELIRTVQNQLQGSTVAMAQVIKAQGEEISVLHKNMEDIVQKYTRLTYHDDQITNEINKIYSMVFDNARLTEGRFQNLEQEVKELEKLSRLQKWITNIKFQEFSGQEYKEMETIEKLICIVSDFFYLTNGVWDDDILLFIKSALDNLDVESNDILLYEDVVYRLVIDDRYRRYLFDRNGICFCFNSSEEMVVPYYEALMQGIYLGKRINELEETLSSKQIAAYLDEKGMNVHMGTTAFDMACVFLVAMSAYHEYMNESAKLTAYRDIEKAALLGDLQAKQQYIQILLKHNYIEEAYQQILALDRVLSDNDEFALLKNKVLEKYAVL